MGAVRAVARERLGTPDGPPIQFVMHEEAASYNLHLLEEHGLDFDKFIEVHRNTTLDYGSEFWLIKQLKSILGKHPHFLELRRFSLSGWTTNSLRTSQKIFARKKLRP